MRRITGGILIASTVAVLAAGTSFGQQFEWKGELIWGSGTYTMTERTNTKAFVNTFTWSNDRIRVEIAIPYIDQDTPFVRFAGGMPVPTGRHHADAPNPKDHGGGGGGGGGHGGPIEVPDPGTLNFDQRGLGDPILRVDAVILGDLSFGRALGVWAAVKAPIADAGSAFGTGEWDSGCGLAFAFNTNQTWFWAEAGYWLLGDPSEFDLINPFVVRLEFDRGIGSGNWSLGAAFDGSSETVEGAGDRAVLSGALRRHFKLGRHIELKVGVGLTDASPDWVTSIGWRLPF